MNIAPEWVGLAFILVVVVAVFYWIYYLKYGGKQEQI